MSALRSHLASYASPPQRTKPPSAHGDASELAHHLTRQERYEKLKTGCAGNHFVFGHLWALVGIAVAARLFVRVEP